jgi:1-acyl-sn-glycerol-3-phosphate acyltransferase
MPGESFVVTQMRSTALRGVFYYWVLLWGGIITGLATIGSVLTQVLTRRADWFGWWARLWGKSMFLGMGIRVRTSADAELDPDTSYVFVSNHQNLLDIPVLAVVLDCPFGYVAKAELARVPFLGLALRYSPSVFLERSTPRKSYESMKKAGETIRKGLSVVIFPEGARSYCRELLPFRKGALLLALEAGVDIVPITIIDGYEVIDESRKLAAPGVIHVHMGAPISLEGRTRTDIQEVLESIESRMRVTLCLQE